MDCAVCYRVRTGKGIALGEIASSNLTAGNFLDARVARRPTGADWKWIALCLGRHCQRTWPFGPRRRR